MATGSFRLLVRLGGLGVLLAVLAAALTWASLTPARQLAAGAELGYQAALGATAAAVGWLLLAWFAGCLALALLARLPGVAGRCAARFALAVTPAVVRHALHVALGATLAFTGTGHLAYADTAPPSSPADGAAGPGTGTTADGAPGPGTGTTANGTAGPGMGTTANGTAGPGTTANGTNTTGLSTTANGADTAGRTEQPMPRPDRPTRDPDRRTRDQRTVVVVRPGDTLWDIAAGDLPGHPSAAQVAAHWPRWYAANRSTIGPDPDLIHPGQRLRPPAR